MYVSSFEHHIEQLSRQQGTSCESSEESLKQSNLRRDRKQYQCQASSAKQPHPCRQYMLCEVTLPPQPQLLRHLLSSHSNPFYHPLVYRFCLSTHPAQGSRSVCSNTLCKNSLPHPAPTTLAIGHACPAARPGIPCGCSTVHLAGTQGTGLAAAALPPGSACMPGTARGARMAPGWSLWVRPST